ncbi:MAG: hypothetical protein M3037_01350, partial [Gemmatimonadota bacterium]|nr:hypothetical protein [Gemmatimonadota bacterium]
REILVVLFEVEIGGSRPHTFPCAIDESWKISITVGTDDEAHVLRPIEQMGAKPLSHAAGDADNRSLFHSTFHLAYTADNTLLSMFPYRTGIDQNDVSTIGLRNRIVARLDQLPEHELSVADIHLTTVGLYVDRWAGRLEHEW